MTVATLSTLAAACSGNDPVSPDTGTPGIHVLFGASQSDTVDAELPQALIVQVRGTDGRIAKGVQVRFDAQAPADPTRNTEPAVFVCPVGATACGGTQPNTFVVETTDDNGQAAALVKLGHVAGRAVVKLSVASLSFTDSSTYTVNAGAATRVRTTIRDTLLQVGTTLPLPVRLFDRYNNVRPDLPAFSTSAGSAVTIDAASGVVTARELGVQTLFVRRGGLLDSTTVTVLPKGRLVAWSSPEAALYMVNLDGSQRRVIASNVASSLGVFPQFDPSRARFAIHTGSPDGISQNVVVLDTSGLVLRVIAPTSGFSLVLAQRLLADGTILVLGKRPGASAYTVSRVASDGTISQVAILGGSATPITDTGFPRLQAYGAADFSPDGTQLAFSVTPSAGAALELRVLTLATGATAMVAANAGTPLWSPQSDRIVFLYGPLDAGRTGFPTIINPDGTGRREISHANLDAGFAWSPDAVYLVGHTRSTGALRIVRVSDGTTVLLPRPGPEFTQVDWQ